MNEAKEEPDWPFHPSPTCLPSPVSVPVVVSVVTGEVVLVVIGEVVVVMTGEVVVVTTGEVVVVVMLVEMIVLVDVGVTVVVIDAESALTVLPSCGSAEVEFVSAIKVELVWVLAEASVTALQARLAGAARTASGRRERRRVGCMMSVMSATSQRRYVLEGACGKTSGGWTWSGEMGMEDDSERGREEGMDEGLGPLCHEMPAYISIRAHREGRGGWGNGVRVTST